MSSSPESFGTIVHFASCLGAPAGLDVNYSPSSPTSCSSRVHSPGTSLTSSWMVALLPHIPPLLSILFFFSIYLFLAVLGLPRCSRAFSSYGEGSYSLSVGHRPGFSLRWLLLLQRTGCRCVGFSSCGMWARSFWSIGSIVVVQGPSYPAAWGIFLDQESYQFPVH